MTAGTDEQLAVVASKVDDLRTAFAELRDAVNQGIETKVAVKNLTERVDELEDSQRWLTRTAVGALILAILSAALNLPV